MTNQNDDDVQDDDQDGQEAAQDGQDAPQPSKPRQYRVDREGYVHTPTGHVFVGRSLVGGLVTINDPV